MKEQEKTVREIFEILEEAHSREYIGEPISQLEHALQCAKAAQDAGGSSEMVIAGLLHDIGHLCTPGTPGIPGTAGNATSMGEYGIDQHHRYAGQLLRQWGFSETVAQLVEGHVEAKRYLVAQNPKYHQQLSLASQETLKRQGGPMSDDERQRYQKHPLLKEILKLRVFDDQAKQVGWTVPTLESYREMILSHLRT